MPEFFKAVTKGRFLRLLDFLNGHGVQYFASGGTLLGAIRHRGIIPWDNDCDIGIREADTKAAFDLLTSQPAYYIWQHEGDDSRGKPLRPCSHANRALDYRELRPEKHIYIVNRDDDAIITDLELFISVPYSTVKKRRLANHVCAVFWERLRIYSYHRTYWWLNRHIHDLSQGMLVYGIEGFRYRKDGRFNIPYAMAFSLREVPFYDRTIKVFNKAETYLKIKYGENCLTHTSHPSASDYESRFFDRGVPITDFSPL